jgi:hexokinase
VHEALIDIFGDKGKNIITHHAEDGSGMGAALIAGALLIFIYLDHISS